MIFFEMLRWWYVTGWIEAMRRVTGWAQKIEQFYSLSILVKTLFAPWKRITTLAGRGLDAKVHAALDNLVSRFVGFVIRLFAIFAALVSISSALLAGLVMAVIWPFMPLLVIYFAVRGIMG